jgi:hypothetical protein
VLAGKKLKLEQNTLALGTVDGNRRAIIIPAGAIIKVVSGPAGGDGNQMLDVMWERRILTVFALDVGERGTEIAEPMSRNLSARA